MKKKTMKDLCSRIAKLEGKGHQCSIGDIREVFRCFADLVASTDKEWLDVLYEYSLARACKQRAKARKMASSKQQRIPLLKG